MSSILEKIKTYGVKGVCDFLRGKLETQRMQRTFLENALRHPMASKPGLTIVGSFCGQGSISKVARDFCFNLKQAGIPFQTYDLSQKHNANSEDAESILTPREDFRALKYDHVVEMFHSPFPDLPGVKRARVVFWEFETGLLEYDPRLNDGTQTIAMSDFNRDVFTKVFAGSPVSKILYPFRFEMDDFPPADEMRAKYGIGANDFVVFYNFDLGSSYYRKNPEGALRAFAAAFADNEKTKFVMKIMGARKHADMLEKLLKIANELGVLDKVVTITEYLPQKELYGLTNACDVYLSLHRGEGFGLGIAEAMSLGKAVVVTDYSGSCEFCTPETAMLVPYTMVDVPPEQVDHPSYRFVQKWAEPNIAAASTELKELYGNPALRSDIGRRAKLFMQEHFSMNNHANSVRVALSI